MTVQCSSCGFDNPPGMKFCGNCGSRLDAGGPAQPPAETLGVMVGADLLERFRRAGLEARGQRRAVTVLFVDLSGYTRLAAELGDEDLYELVQRFIRALAEDVYRYEGMVDKLTGDGLMALYGAPIAFENNAERAVRSALDMLGTIQRLSQATPALKGRTLELHIGLNAGSVIVGGLGPDALMNYTAIGDSVNLARRLEEIAQAGTILASEAVYHQTRRLFEFEQIDGLALKGFEQAVTAYQVARPKERPGAARGLEGLHAPMVGRETELSRLLAILERAVQERKGTLILLTGEGGMGKSRLTAELKARLDPRSIQVLEGQSLTYRKSIPYWIFQEVMRHMCGAQPDSAAEEVRARLEALIQDMGLERPYEVLPYLAVMMGLALPESEARHLRYLDAGQLRQRIFLAVRDVMTAAARKKAILLILEDLHWADDASLDLILFLLDAVRAEPIVIYAISRPYEGSAVARIPERAQQRLATRTISIRLQALQPDQTKQLLSALLSIQELPEELRERIVTRAAGSPFYLEEIIRMLIEDGVLYQEEGRWRYRTGTDSVQTRVPDSLQGLILARLDRLEPDQRRLLQTAAVIGDRFKLPVLLEVMAGMAEARSVLAGLVEREFLLPEGEPGQGGYAFKHTLVTDAIYATLLQRERSELHTQVGLAIERLYAGRIEGQVELLASHFLRSPLLDRALRYLILAGQKAAKAYAPNQARTIFAQAEEILAQVEHGIEQELAVQGGLGDALVTVGEYPGAIQHFRAALQRLDGEDGVGRSLQRSVLERKIANALERQGEYDQAMECLAAAERTLEENPGSDTIEQARILSDTGWICFRRGDLDGAERDLEQALALAEPSEQLDVIASIYNRLGGVYFQRDQADKARAFVQRSLALRERIGDIVAVARTYNNLGLLDWKQGAWQSAFDNFSHAYQQQANLGDVEGMIEVDSNLGLLETERGRFREAEGHLLAALERARQIGHSYQMGLAFLHLTLLCVNSGEWQRALDFGGQSLDLFENIGARDHLLGLHAILGLAWLGKENLEKADESARKAQEVYEALGGDASGRLDDYARLVYLLAEIALTRGQNEQAETCYRRCIALFEQTGDSIQRARALLRLAETAQRRGYRGEAQDWLKEARAILDQYGSPQDIERARSIQLEDTTS